MRQNTYPDVNVYRIEKEPSVIDSWMLDEMLDPNFC